MFGAAALYGATTKRSLASIGAILFMGLIGLIVAMVVNLFLQSSQITWLISIVGVVLFTGLTAWDVQRIQNGDLRRRRVDGEGGSHWRARPLPRLHQPVLLPAPPDRRPPLTISPFDTALTERRPNPGRAMAAGEPRLTVALTFDHDAISSEVDRGDGPVLR